MTPVDAQRSRGVTVMIGNSKARRQRAKDGEHFGPLSAPSMAKIDHQLKDLREQKKNADKELEDAEDAHANGIEIATIKKKKLAIKDRIAILEAKIEKVDGPRIPLVFFGESVVEKTIATRTAWKPENPKIWSVDKSCRIS